MGKVLVPIGSFPIDPCALSLLPFVAAVAALSFAESVWSRGALDCRGHFKLCENVGISSSSLLRSWRFQINPNISHWQVKQLILTI